MENEPQAAEHSQSPTNTTDYRVLARKYRPENFSQLVGQDALVQTLTNAMKLGRIAQAFMLTGVRGVGKTSTARIIAKGLNCQTPAADGTPRIEPCNQCQNCVDIGKGKHIDVLEMDAASNTGVDDVREIIEGSAYRPVSAVYKIYIIDEVHMLSKNAFNALLKTLEEPPENVKFIFATTEIRKVPATILSRCQRFDLRRVRGDMLAAHLNTICEAEQITAEPAALTLIAKAGEGSVRDALSMLDQAAAMGADKVTEQAVMDMLGQAGTEQMLQLLSACLDGKADEALSLYDAADHKGAEPELILAEMLEILHEASLSAAGAALEDMAESRLAGIKEIAKTGISKLGRSWQLLLKGYDELRLAPDSRAAAKMVIIRLCHISPLPTPAEIIRKLPDAPSHPPAGQTSHQNAEPAPEYEQQAIQTQEQPAEQRKAGAAHIAEQPAPASSPAPLSSPAPASLPEPAKQPEPYQTAEPEQPSLQSLTEIVSLCEEHGEYILASHIISSVRLVSLSHNRLEVELTDGADDKFIAQLAKCLSQWTQTQWLVSLKAEGGEATLAEQQEQAYHKQVEVARTDPLVSAVLDKFPSAEVTQITSHQKSEPAAQAQGQIK